MMQIIINDKRKISSVQTEFSKRFPFLKIEFLIRANLHANSAASAVVKDTSKTLGECRRTHDSGRIDINPSNTVLTLREKFLHQYGLSIMIFRRSDKVWLQTSSTNNWTLEEQNKEAETLWKQLSGK